MDFWLFALPAIGSILWVYVVEPKIKSKVWQAATLMAAGLGYAWLQYSHQSSDTTAQATRVLGDHDRPPYVDVFGPGLGRDWQFLVTNTSTEAMAYNITIDAVDTRGSGFLPSGRLKFGPHDLFKSTAYSIPGTTHVEPKAELVEFQITIRTKAGTYAQTLLMRRAGASWTKATRVLDENGVERVRQVMLDYPIDPIAGDVDWKPRD